MGQNWGYGAQATCLGGQERAGEGFLWISPEQEMGPGKCGEGEGRKEVVTGDESTLSDDLQWGLGA